MSYRRLHTLDLGFSVVGNNSFLSTLKRNLSEGREIHCSTDEYRTPVDVHTLSECVLELIQIDYSGLLHVGSVDSMNRFELSKKAAMLMCLDHKLVVKKQPDSDKPERVPRHKNGILDVSRAKKLLTIKMLSVEESIARAIRERNIFYSR